MTLILLIALLLVGLVLLALAVSVGRRRWRGLVRWGLAVICALLGVVVGAVDVVGLLGEARLNSSHPNPVSTLAAATSADQLARGEHLAHLCSGCHGSTGDLPLDGGAFNFITGLGTLVPPNLTPAGPLRGWSDGEVVRAIREGVDKDGKVLLIMPAETFRDFSDADVQSLVGYLRSQPSVARATPDKELNVIGAVLTGAGLFPSDAQPPVTAPVSAPAIAATPEYGQYAVAFGGCRVCHGNGLTGGTPGRFVPVGPNLLPLVPRWSEADFVKTIRTGTDPFGRALDPQMMPWKELSQTFSDTELSAIYQYIVKLAG